MHDDSIQTRQSLGSPCSLNLFAELTNTVAAALFASGVSTLASDVFPVFARDVLRHLFANTVLSRQRHKVLVDAIWLEAFDLHEV